MKPTQALHEAGQSAPWRCSSAARVAASWQDLLARIGARHEQLARTA
jgi:hypothetical protein